PSRLSTSYGWPKNSAFQANRATLRIPNSTRGCQELYQSIAVLYHGRLPKLILFTVKYPHRGSRPDRQILLDSALDTTHPIPGRLHEGSVVISVVDDDESILDSTRQLLRSAGYTVSTFASAKAFLDSGSVESSECVILDVKMPGMDGLELQRQLIDSGARVPVVFISAHDDARTRDRAIRAGAMDFLKKPFDAGKLLTTIETALGWPATGPAPHILHFGINDRYRGVVLRSVGYSVQECSTPSELLQVFEPGAHTDLICISEDLVELPPLEVLAVTKRKCNVPVAFFRGTSRTYSGFKFDLEIEALTPPAKWLSDVRRILAGSRELHL